MPAPRVSLGDWLYFTISLLFFAMSVLLLFSPRDRRVAMLGVALCGPCVLLFGSIILRKVRRQRFSARLVSTLPGAELRMSVGRLLMFALMVATPAIAALILDSQDGSWARLAFAATLLSLAAVFVGLVVTGRASRTFMRFEVAGLTIGMGGNEFLVAWNNIADVVQFDFMSNECVGLVIADLSAVVVASETLRARVDRLLTRNREMYGCHVMFATLHFGVDSAPLAAALRRYAADADARRELSARPAIQAPS